MALVDHVHAPVGHYVHEKSQFCHQAGLVWGRVGFHLLRLYSLPIRQVTKRRRGLLQNHLVQFQHRLARRHLRRRLHHPHGSRDSNKIQRQPAKQHARPKDQLPAGNRPLQPNRRHGLPGHLEPALLLNHRKLLPERRLQHLRLSKLLVRPVHSIPLLHTGGPGEAAPVLLPRD